MLEHPIFGCFGRSLEEPFGDTHLESDLMSFQLSFDLLDFLYLTWCCYLKVSLQFFSVLAVLLLHIEHCDHQLPCSVPFYMSVFSPAQSLYTLCLKNHKAQLQTIPPLLNVLLTKSSCNLSKFLHTYHSPPGCPLYRPSKSQKSFMLVLISQWFILSLPASAGLTGLEPLRFFTGTVGTLQGKKCRLLEVATEW